MQNDELVLQLLKELRDSVSSLEKNIVGQAHCDAYRKDFDRKLQSHDDQIRELKTVCDGYMVARENLVDGVDLIEAKGDAVREAGMKSDELAAEIREIKASIAVIQEYPRLASIGWKFIWANPVLRVLVIGLLGGAYVGALGTIGVYWGRIGQYGWHIVIAVLLTIMLVTVAVLLTRRNSRDATKKLMMRL